MTPAASGGGRADGGREETAADPDGARSRAWAWRLALFSPLVVPWVAVRTTSVTLVFVWGMVALEGTHVTLLPAYLEATAGLPRFLRMWPIGVACYVLGAAWAAGERVGADGRVAAGLLALAALATGWMAWGLAAEPARSAIPIGSFVLGGIAGWAYVRSRV